MADHSYADDAARIVRQAEQRGRLSALYECQSLVNRRLLAAIGTPQYGTIRPIADEVNALVEAAFQSATSIRRAA